MPGRVRVTQQLYCSPHNCHYHLILSSLSSFCNGETPTALILRTPPQKFLRRCRHPPLPEPPQFPGYLLPCSVWPSTGDSSLFSSTVSEVQASSTTHRDHLDLMRRTTAIINCQYLWFAPPLGRNLYSASLGNPKSVWTALLSRSFAATSATHRQTTTTMGKK